MVPVWITKVVNAKPLTLIVATLVVGSVIVPFSFIARFGDLNAAGQEGTGLTDIIKIFSSDIDFSEIRIYGFGENRTIDVHTDEQTLSSVSEGTKIVVHGVVSNQNYTAEHFDYVTEVFDSRGIVVYLDIRYGVAAPLGGQVGIDSSVPIVLGSTGTYTVKVFGVSNLREGPVMLLSVASRSIQAVEGNSVADQAPEVPNIVVVMADDLDQRSTEILLDNGLMPNLQQYIIDKGVTFTESFATYPICCPSRATFLTGQYPHNHNVMNNALPLGGVTKLNDSSTLATWLQDAGYRTLYVGKYLNGYGEDTTETYIPPGWDDWQATTGNQAYRMYSYDVNDNGAIIDYTRKESDYQTDVLAQRAVQAIAETEAIDSTPFFLYVNPLAPHEDGRTPDCALNYGDIATTRPAARHIGKTSNIEFPRPPSFNETDVSDKPNVLQVPPLNEQHTKCFEDLFHARLETMLAVDELIGQIVMQLINNNELDHTVVVFTSDNGLLMGEHRLHGKQRVYEESIRVPLYVRVPRVAPGLIDKLVINNDLAPTFLEISRGKAGIVIDGRSLMPLINNPSISWRNGFLIEDNLYTAVRTADYVYAWYYTGASEIYDLETDPYQLENSRRDPAWSSKIGALEEWRAALAACKGTECQLLEDRPAP